MLERLLGAWFADLGAALAAADQRDPADATDLICASLARHPNLRRLLPIAASILEQNITQDVARAYTQQLLPAPTRETGLGSRPVVLASACCGA